MDWSEAFANAWCDAADRKPSRHLIIDSLGHEREVATEEYQAKRAEAIEATKRPLMGDGLNDREHFKRVFTNGWDFSQFAR